MLKRQQWTNTTFGFNARRYCLVTHIRYIPQDRCEFRLSHNVSCESIPLDKVYYMCYCKYLLVTECLKLKEDLILYR